MRGIDIVIGVLVVLGIVFVYLYFNSAVFATGVLLQPTESRVNIPSLVTDISFDCGILGAPTNDNIDFLDVTPTAGGVFDVDAEHNSDGPDTDGGGAAESQYCIEKGPGSTIDVEVCIYANDPDPTGGATGDLQIQPSGFVIPIDDGGGNGEDYIYDNDPDMDVAPTGPALLTFGLGNAVLASHLVTDSVNTYYTLQLDVTDENQPQGEYTNEVVFVAQDPNCIGPACACAT